MDKRVEERVHQRLAPYLQRISEHRDDEHDVLPALFALLLEQQKTLENRLQQASEDAEMRAKAQDNLFQQTLAQQIKEVRADQQKFGKVSIVLASLNMLLLSGLLVLHLIK